MPKIKRSYGIALCRHRNRTHSGKSHTDGIEIVMVKKSYTYQFADFVSGRYKKNNNKHLIYMFSCMSHKEKMYIRSMKFDLMWYIIWPYCSNTSNNQQPGEKGVSKNILKNHAHVSKQNPIFDSSAQYGYHKKKSKFESVFLRDSGKRLLSLLNCSTSSESQWELPKGHKHASEKNIDAAIREFKEETGIKSSQYRILYNIPPIIERYTDSNVTYINEYYIAYPLRELKPKVMINNYSQLFEVECIKWIKLEELNFTLMNKKIAKRTILLFREVESRYKKSLSNMSINYSYIKGNIM